MPAKPSDQANSADAVDVGPLAGCIKRQLGIEYGHVEIAKRLAGAQRTPAFEVQMTKRGKRIIVFGDGHSECNVYPVGRAIAGSYGDYLGDGRRLRAFLVPEVEGECNINDQCRAAVVIRDEDKVFLQVARTSTGCGPAEASTLRIFDDRDSLRLTCGTPMGGEDHLQHTHLLHADESGLRAVLSFRQGYSEGVAETDAAGNEVFCRSQGSGSIKVVARGAEPRLEVFEPSEDAAGEEYPSGTLSSWRWRSDRVSFVKGASEAHTSKTSRKRLCEPIKR